MSTYSVVIARRASGVVEHVLGQGLSFMQADRMCSDFVARGSIRDGCSFRVVNDKDLA